MIQCAFQNEINIFDIVLLILFKNIQKLTKHNLKLKRYIGIVVQIW